MYGFTYITTNLANGMKYIGRRKYDDRGQWKSYIGSGRAFRKAVNKYGKENFQREIIQSYETEDELNKAEEELINLHNAVNDRNYYNLSNGGKTESGYHMPEKARKIVSEKVKASFTDERREIYRRRMKENNPNADGHVLRGKKLSEEARKRNSEAQKGKSGLKGSLNPMFGKTGEKHPAYGKQVIDKRLSELYEKRKEDYIFNSFVNAVICEETNKLYGSIKIAAEEMNVNPVTMLRAAKKIKKTCRGFHWHIATDDEIERYIALKIEKEGCNTEIW